MKVIVAGTRTVTDPNVVAEAIKSSGFEITELVSGTARGVDQLGEKWAKHHGIPVKRFPAQWDAHGKLAGRIRNEQMARYAEALLAIWDGQSPGTKNMIQLALKYNLDLKVYCLSQDERQ